jgi:small subunit ribosomal protein S4
MARYIGPKSRIARKFRDPIFGADKHYEKKNYPPGMHGQTKRRAKQSEYGTQLMEKQKAKYTYGILERQFRNIFLKASLKIQSILYSIKLLTLKQTMPYCKASLNLM